MSTDEDLKQQLAEYFGWLEEHLGSDMRPSGTHATRGATSRVGRGVLAIFGVAGLVALTVAVVNRDDGAGRVVPASTAADTSVDAPTTSSASTVLPTIPSALATSWAPVNLPEGMQVVDVSWGSELPGFVVPLARQHFARATADGTKHDATLSLRVKESQEEPPEFSTGQVHGLSISAVQSEILGVVTVTGWWVEHGLFIEFATTGYTLQEVIELLDATALRADPAQGFEPDSIPGGMSLLYETVGTQPRPYTKFIIETDSGYVTVETLGGVYGLPDASLEVIPGVGRLLTSTWTTVVLTDDGTALSISPSWPNGNHIGVPPEAVAVARSIAHVDEATVIALATAATARELALREVGRVVVGANEVILRGGTPELPEALCVVVSGVEGCTLNHRVPSAATLDLPWTNEWLLAGDNWFFVTYRPNEAGFGNASVCPADADGSIGEPLQYDLSIDGDRVWTVTQIPANASFTMVCGWARVDEPIDLLPPSNISNIVRRPPV